MPTELILPRVDMDMTTGRISRWYADDGAHVDAGKPLFEIETDKAAMEIDAPASGRLQRIVGVDRDVPVGSTVGWLLADGESPVDVAGNGGDASASAGVAGPAVTLVGTGADASGPDTADALTGGDRDAVAGSGIRATPLARRMARERGIDLGGLRGSGPRGRIQASDVAAAEAQGASPGPEVQGASPGAASRDPASGLPPIGLATADARPAPDPAIPAPFAPSPQPRERGEAGLNAVWLRRGNGVPIVLVHGFGSDLNGWRPFVQALPPGRAVLGVDLPGHGLSPAGARSFEAIVEAVEAALRSHGLVDAHLVGHSLGGAVATALAARAGVDARSLCLLAPAGLGPDIHGAFVAGFARATLEAAIAGWMRLLVTDAALITPALVRATARARIEAGNAAALAELADALFPQSTQGFETLSCLRRLSIPVRLIHGADDRIIAPPSPVRLPFQVALHTLAGIGHMPHVEARDLVATLLLQTIRSAE